uniref:Uncharacterized protein n=1 Tax=Anopheles farauti TaxID=69004 RepID=A0A182QR10_9DIPT
MRWVDIILLLLCSCSTTESFVTLIPVLTKFGCKYNERIVNVTYRIENENTITNQSLYFDIAFTRALKEMKFQIAYYGVSKNNEPALRVFERTVDVCTYVRRPSADRLVKRVYDHMAVNSRLPSVCPIAEKERFYIHDMRPAAIRIPGFLPESSFIFDTNYYSGVKFEPLTVCRFHGNLLTMTYYIVSKNGETMNRMFQRMVDLCTFAKHSGSDRLVQLVYVHIQKNNRFPTRCPLKEKEVFYIRNLRPAAIKIPGFLPESKFALDNNYHTGATSSPVVAARFYGKLVRVISTELKLNR